MITEQEKKDIFGFSWKTKVGDKDVTIDNSLLMFNEQSLTQFIQDLHPYYSYYGAMLAEAENELADAELALENHYDEVYSQFKKSEKGSDKLCESLARMDLKYQDMAIKVNYKKRVVKSLQYYLKSWDKAHDNAQSLGHFLRKEMDKLNADIRISKDDEKLDRYMKRVLENE